MKYLSVKEAAAQWEISPVTVRKYCREGRIPTAIQQDKGALIPEDAEKPGLPPAEEVPVKVDDIIEIVNHFTTCAHVLDTVMKPLSLAYIRNIHRDLTYGTYADRSNRIVAGAFRSRPPKVHAAGAAKPERISLELDRLIRGYEKRSLT